ncbi:triose-phosphate isomerase [Spelaeicoccus albus]|uniref:Triosephosphate isomerase n=1 Tax=Spelaeicoccus albus TaxID=1280376 RepID=A0A7Z0D441_9MICO|nr:triose-phosphate isomerase [Spelaeicoccus albus]NYI68534.1 triosephosphate isomerase [Spelaeicoccus albus]
MATAQRVPLIAGNWKMNLDHMQAISTVQKLAWTLDDAGHDFKKVEVAVLPPFTDIRSVQTIVHGDKLDLAYGAQDISTQDSGAFTGDVSGAFLARLGCSYVAVGHSERREHHGEDDDVVRAKVEAAYRHGITPILCLGENLEVRQSGDQVAHAVGQLRAATSSLQPAQVESLVVAYEPIWAIGTGEVATPDDAQEVAEALRGAVAESFSPELAGAVRVLYGGSVKSSNVASIMAKPDVDGALVGGASLDPKEFAAICRYQDHNVAL